MFGGTQYWVGVTKKLPTIRSIRRDRKFSEENKTYISALAVLESKRTTGIKMTIYQNPYAENPIDFSIFSDTDVYKAIL